MKKTILASLAAVFAAATPSLAQSTNPVVQLDAVRVTASRLPQDTLPAADYPGNVSVITRADIERSPNFNLQDILAQQVGFTPLDTVGFGTQTAPFGMRGYAEKASTLVLVDGVRVNDAGDGFFLWNSVPIENIERIEIIRGGASTIYGEGAAAGVINIITKAGSPDPFSSNVSFSGGNYGYYDGHLELSGTEKGVTWRFNADREEWAGWRDGANFRSWNLGGRLGTTLPIGRLSLAYTFHTQYSENPGNLTPAQFQANPRQVGGTLFTFENEVHRLNLGYQHEIESGWKLAANFHVRSYNTFSTGFGPVITEQPSIGFIGQASHEHEFLHRDNRFTLGGEVRRQDFFQTGFGSTIFDTFDSSVFFEDRIELSPRTAFTAGARYDDRSSSIVLPFPVFRGEKDNTQWSYKFSLDHDLTEKTRLWSSWSLAYRLPSANDVVSSSPAFPGNPELVPLQSRTAEIGFRSQLHRLLETTFAYYYSDVKDDIYSETGAPAFGGANNADVIRQGVELSLKSRPTKALSLYFNTAYAEAEFDGGPRDGNRLVQVPKWQINAGLTLQPDEHWTFTLNNVYVGGQVRFFDLANALPTNAYNVLNARLAYRWCRYETFVAVNNLLDRVYEQFPASTFAGAIARNPAPGISFRVGLNAKF